MRILEPQRKRHIQLGTISVCPKSHQFSASYYCISFAAGRSSFTAHCARMQHQTRLLFAKRLTHTGSGDSICEKSKGPEFVLRSVNEGVPSFHDLCFNLRICNCQLRTKLPGLEEAHVIPSPERTLLFFFLCVYSSRFVRGYFPSEHGSQNVHFEQS